MTPFNLNLPIAIGCDHAGFYCKEDLISLLEGEGLVFKDFGTFSKESVDYPALHTLLPMLLSSMKLLLEFYFVAAPMEWPSAPISTRA